MQISDSVRAQALAARAGAVALSTASRGAKDAALHAMADALVAGTPRIVAAESAGTSAAIIDRLRLSEDRIAGMVQGLRDLAGLPDPVGDVVRGWTNPNGVRVRQVRVPFGVVGIIYEARPNVTADAAGIAVKSGNAVLLRGSSSAANSNAAVVAALREGLSGSALPTDAVQLVPGPREVTGELMQARGLVDVLIPRGGAGLIEYVVTGSQVPVIETGTGNCHLYVDATADADMARELLVNAKVQRPSVCNAVETVLVHRDRVDDLLASLAEAMGEHGVRLHADERARAALADSRAEVVDAVAEDWDTEYLSLDLAVAVVDDLDAALAHIRRHSSGHSETIVTSSLASAERFTAEVDAAAVLVNASSRFVDGGEFGFGAEIGIHARGPMGLQEMTTTKYVVTGEGQVR